MLLLAAPLYAYLILARQQPSADGYSQCALASPYDMVEGRSFYYDIVLINEPAGGHETPELSLSLTQAVTGSAGPMAIAVTPSTAGLPERSGEYTPSARVIASASASQHPSPWSNVWWCETSVAEAPPAAAASNARPFRSCMAPRTRSAAMRARSRPGGGVEFIAEDGAASE